MAHRRCAVLMVALLVSVVTPAQTLLQPEIATGFSPKADVVTHQFAVATANPLATQAGRDILRAGGSAVDAAIAVQMVLGLVEPQSSGLGGGALLLHSVTPERGLPRIQAFDGRETAPATASEDMLLNAQGKPLAFHEAVVGGRAVGTPGVLHMLAQAHAQHGRLPWVQLFQPAIALATHGFSISPRLHAQLTADPYLRLDPVARDYFYQANGEPHPIGFVRRNPELAKLLQDIATQGVQAFYRGNTALAMVHKVQQHPTNPGRLALADLAGYQSKERDALCFDHAALRHVYRVCGFPPPSSGAIAMGQILGMLANRDELALSSAWLHTYIEASRLALADRAQYIADPDFVDGPGGDWRTLLNPAYLRERAQLIGPMSMLKAEPGSPVRSRASTWAPMVDQPEYGTSHISIVDGWGNALAMTTTIEDAFGARQMVHGFLLNNQLTDFSFAPRDDQGRPIANRVQAGKRPRSSMSPTLVFDKASGQLVMSVGSPGGHMIIHYTTKTLLGVLNWGMTPQQAIDLPNFGWVAGPVVLESQRFSPALQDDLRARGTAVREAALPSGVQAIVRRTVNGREVWVGAADPRREGAVMGD